MCVCRFKCGEVSGGRPLKILPFTLKVEISSLSIQPAVLLCVKPWRGYKKTKTKNKYWLHKKILAAFNHLRTKWLTSAEQARKVGTMLIGHCLKGQFKPKSMIHVFPLACSAIYHAIKNFCILSDIKLSFFRIHDSVTRDNPQTVAVSTFMFDF